MAFEQREGSGVLFKNDRKTSPTAPEYKGTALVNGVEMDVAAWVKEGKNGKFFSLSIKPKNQYSNGNGPVRQSRPMPDETEDLPF